MEKREEKLKMEEKDERGEYENLKVEVEEEEKM